MVKGKSPKCGRCGEFGHNARTCKGEPKKPPVDDKPSKRDRTGKFLPGNKGNPGGWNKATQEARQKVSDMVRGRIEMTDAHLVFDRLVEIVTCGEPKDSVYAGKVLLEYAYGRPTQQVEHKGSVGMIHEVRGNIASTLDGLATRIEAARDS